MQVTSNCPTSLTANQRASRPLGRIGVIAVAAMLASGCTMLQEDKIDYKSAQRGSTLDVPPDLTQLSRDSRYNVPGTAVTARPCRASTSSIASAWVSSTPRSTM